VLEKRDMVYAAARNLNPLRWTSNTRNWIPVGNVELNPENIKKAA